MVAGLHECRGSRVDLSKDVVAEGEVDAVGHLQTVQLALPDVGQAAPDQRHLPTQNAQRVQGNECAVSAAGSILSGPSSTPCSWRCSSNHVIILSFQSMRHLM